MSELEKIQRVSAVLQNQSLASVILEDLVNTGVLAKPFIDCFGGNKSLNRFEVKCYSDAKTELYKTLTQYLCEMEKDGIISINESKI